MYVIASEAKQSIKGYLFRENKEMWIASSLKLLAMTSFIFYFHKSEAFHQIQLDWRHEYAYHSGLGLGDAPAFRLEPGTFQFSRVHFRCHQQLPDEPHLEFQE